MTAAELMEQLADDHDRTARLRSADEERRKRVEAWRAAERPLVSDLHAVGIRVDSVWDLVNTSEPYPVAIPVLLRHLPADYPDRVKEGMARALSVPEARQGWAILVEQFEQNDDATTLGAKWALACALEVAADDSVIDDIARLVTDMRHGENRAPLLAVLARSASPTAKDLLRELQSDREIGSDARTLLRGSRR